MFHEDSNHNIDQDKLGHQDKDHEEERSENCGDTAVLETVWAGVALLTDGVFHNPIPIVSWQW